MSPQQNLSMTVSCMGSIARVTRRMHRSTHGPLKGRACYTLQTRHELSTIQALRARIWYPKCAHQLPQAVHCNPLPPSLPIPRILLSLLRSRLRCVSCAARSLLSASRSSRAASSPAKEYGLMATFVLCAKDAGHPSVSVRCSWRRRRRPARGMLCGLQQQQQHQKHVHQRRKQSGSLGKQQ